MSKPTQIILDDIYLPYTGRDRYSCHEDLLTVRLEMISGRMVEEVRGAVWRATYSYDYMGNDLCRQVLAVLRRGGPIPAAVLPDNSDEMVSSSFMVESLTPPTFAFSKDGVGLWHNLAFTLREVEPHD